MEIIEKIFSFILKQRALGFLIYIVFLFICLILGPKYGIFEFLYINGFAFFCCLVGVILYFDSFKSWRRKRLIENIPAANIASMALGLVEISGITEYADESGLYSSWGSPCVLNLQESCSKETGYVRTCSTTPFYLRDDSSKVLINPEGAELLLGKPDVNNSEYSEWAIQAGERLFILGTVSENSNLIQYLKKKLSKKLEDLKTDPDAMAKVDANGDSKIDDEEWDQAVNGIKTDLETEERSHGSGSSLYNLVMEKGETDKIYIISKKSKRDLCNIFSRKARFRIISSAILTLGAATYIILGTYNVNKAVIAGILIAALFFIIISLLTSQKDRWNI